MDNTNAEMPYFPLMDQPEPKLCEVCWIEGDGLAVEARWYLSTIPVCDAHLHCVCGRCHREWATRYAQDGDAVFTACVRCTEILDALEKRREADNQHLCSKGWRGI